MNRNRNDEWYTPKWVIDKVYNVLEHIDLDPASNDMANETVKAKIYYSKDNSSLSEDIKWHGKVFLNPPYSAKLLKLFIKKAVSEYESGNVDELMILTNSGTDTIWNSMLAPYAQAYTIGRISFIDGETLLEKGKGSRGQCMTYMGSNVEKFFKEFSSDGTFWVPNKQYIKENYGHNK